MSKRKAAGLAIQAVGALQGGGSTGTDEAGAGPQGSPGEDKPVSRGIWIGLIVVVVLVLALVAFVLLWDFEGGAPDEGAPGDEAVPTETTGEAGVSAPASSGA